MSVQVSPYTRKRSYQDKIEAMAIRLRRELEATEAMNRALDEWAKTFPRNTWRALKRGQK
jgi:hypothetical protein